METTSRKRSITVGLFVIIGILLFLVGILTIGSMRKVFGSNIHVTSIFDDVNGLKAGNNVWYSGVKIGTVKSIRFLDGSDVEVVLNIEDKSKEFVRKDAKAKVGTDGLIGNKIIVIYGGSQKVQSIEDGDKLEVEKIESTEEMISVLSENNKNLLGITSAFKTISQNILEGKGTVGMLLNDDRIYNDVDQTLAGLKKAADNAQALSVSLAQFTNKLNKKGGLANDLVSDTIIMRDVKATMAKLNNASESADKMIANANQLMINLKSASENPKSTIGVLMSDEKSAADIKSTIKNLESSTEKLDENMTALRSNFLFKRYFKRQDKEAKKLQESNSDTSGVK